VEIALGMFLFAAFSLCKERSKPVVAFLTALPKGFVDFSTVDFIPLKLFSGDSAGESVDRLLDAKSFRCLHD